MIAFVRSANPKPHVQLDAGLWVYNAVPVGDFAVTVNSARLKVQIALCTDKTVLLLLADSSL